MTPKALSREIKFRRYVMWGNENKMEYATIDEIVESGQGGWFNFDEKCPIMQFTGLYDKNGKEIFEGDLIIGPMYARNSFVMFDERYATFKAQSGTQLVPLGYECKIIGNIYEHPHLLTKENK